MAEFWLYAWIDEYEIRSRQEIDRLLRPKSAAVARLAEIAATETWTQASPFVGKGTPVLAGRGIDLSGELDCCHSVCQRRQVNRLFGRVLHYFDDIIVAGPEAHYYAEALTREDENDLENLREHAEALLYIREIGAESVLTFVQKRPACAEHYAQHASEAGLEGLVDGARYWINRLAVEGSVDQLDPHGDHWHYTFNHAALEHTAWGVVRSSSASPPSPQDVAEAVFARYVSHLVSDVMTARDLKVPLGAGVQIHEDALERHGNGQPTADDVALNLELPILYGLPIRDVVKLRHDEWESFQRFQQSLAAAIRERIDAGDSAGDVADRVFEEVLEPSIVDLDSRLRGAQKVLDRKLGLSAAVGALVTTVGLITGSPLVLGASLATFGTAIPAAQRYADARGEIEMSDMYFLWRLESRLVVH